MRKKTFIIMSVILTLIFFSHSPLSAKEIVVLSQFPLSGPHGSLYEFGWGYTDAMNWFNNEVGGVVFKGQVYG